MSKIPVTTDNNKVMVLIDDQFDLSDAWQDIHPDGPVDTKGLTNIGLWIDSTLNDSDRIEWRVMCLASKDSADEYQTQIQTVSQSDVALLPEFYYTSQAAFKGVLPLGISRLTPWIKLQFRVQTEGASPAVLNKVMLTGEREMR
jgi:hypothetical protein